MKKIKVLVVDDSVTIRALLRTVLQETKDIEIVGMVSTGQEALEFLEDVSPHVITLDLIMPGMSGIEFLVKLKDIDPVPVVVLSSLTTRDAAEREIALENGATACFNKANCLSEKEQFIKLIRSAAAQKKAA